MDEVFHYSVLQVALRYEGELFSDMTLEDYPRILDELNNRGEACSPTIERIRFCVLEDSDSNVYGTYDPSTRTICLRVPVDVNNLLHEMIHAYEYLLDGLENHYEKWTPEKYTTHALREYLSARLWQKLVQQVPDLVQRAEGFLEAVGHVDMQAYGGEHDLLFLLKSFDIDLRMNLPLGTTFGYGMAELDADQ